MGYEARANQQRREAARNGPLKEYIVIREVGHEEFEATVNAHLELGYIPAGGVSLFPAKKSPVAGAPIGMAYIQALWLPPEQEITVERRNVEIPPGAVAGGDEGGT